MSERDDKGQFVKGKSGNPGGRKKGVTALVRELSNDYLDYIQLLDQWARDDDIPVKDRRACITDLLNRSMGMPRQSITTEVVSPEPIKFVLAERNEDE